MINNILVTGGAGHIGGALCRKLVENENIYVTILDDLSTGSEHKLPGEEFKNFEFIKADINNLESLKNTIFKKEFDYVFHYAAVVGVERTLLDPIKVLNDIQGVKNILDLCKVKKVKRIFFSGTPYLIATSFKYSPSVTPIDHGSFPLVSIKVGALFNLNKSIPEKILSAASPHS